MVTASTPSLQPALVAWCGCVCAQVVIGRAPTCDVVLEHLSVSRQHAELTTDLAGNLFLTDLGAGAAPPAPPGPATLHCCLSHLSGSFFCYFVCTASELTTDLAGNLFSPTWTPVFTVYTLRAFKEIRPSA